VTAGRPVPASDLAGLVLGSTADKVIHLADRPVLVVR
jgi:nucleotide-binding universal stress UspA family protein